MKLILLTIIAISINVSSFKLEGKILSNTNQGSTTREETGSRFSISDQSIKAQRMKSYEDLLLVRLITWIKAQEQFRELRGKPRFGKRTYKSMDLSVDDPLPVLTGNTTADLETYLKRLDQYIRIHSRPRYG